MMNGDDIWDEDRWEAFLQENDKRVTRYMDLLHQFTAKYPPPRRSDRPARQAWEESLRAFFLRKGLHPEDPVLAFVFTQPGEETEDDASDEPGDAAFVPSGESSGLFDEDDEDDPFEMEALERLPLYRQAFALATDVLNWSDALPADEKVKDSALVQFCSSLNQVPANLAKGHGIGYEQEALGGNIACVKRALVYANAALALLREMKGRPYLRADEPYLHFFEQTFELRNALGLYVQELRRRFELGID